jgi:hypothetical protein
MSKVATGRFDVFDFDLMNPSILAKERRQMRDSQEIKELENQIAVGKKRYGEVERLEAELQGTVPPEGFREATTIGRYRVEKESLASSIRVAEERLAGARSQPKF